MKACIVLSLFFLVIAPIHAQRVVNVYAWGGEIPKAVIRQFEDETKIKVNFATYDNNETLYAKLKASHRGMYDVIIPSAYFVERMHKEKMLSPLNHQKLPNLKNIDPAFLNKDYDPENRYSLPLVWGATGLFYNQQHVSKPPKDWQALWDKSWKNKLLLLDDSREVFAMALLSLKYSPNDSNPEHIRAAFYQLKRLIPNIKLFASERIQAIVIDEDAIAGMAWNGDAFKAQAENPLIGFYYPKAGFVIWVDCLAIPNGASHLKEAYEFINFLLQDKIGAQITLSEGHAITNAKSKTLLPAFIRQNPLIFPPAKILSQGYFQRDLSKETLDLYNYYWQQFKLSL